MIRAGFAWLNFRSQIQQFIEGAIGNVMALPQGVMDFLNESAERAGAEQPKSGDDLFQTGVLDSFALVDFVTVLEDQCGIKVPDSDINPANFQTLETIDRYVTSRKG